MKVLFISPSFYPATYYGGPIFINRAFCDSLATIPHVQVEVLTTDSDGPRRVGAAAVRSVATNYAITFCRRMLPPDIAPGLLLRLPQMIRAADVVHLNGVYSFTTLPTLALCRLMQKPVVWSTLGALQRWQGTGRPRLKKVWEKLCNALCTPQQVLLHATSEAEKSESLDKIPSAAAMILRNGIAIPEINRRGDHRTGDALRLLYIGRLHPIKGIENLLQALKLVKQNFTLSICGEGEVAYQSRLRSLTHDLGLEERVQFRGPVNGEEKDRQFGEADLCIAPSFKEAFCTVVLESLARGVPVIAGRGTPWQRVEEIGCGWWVSNEPAALSAAIDNSGSMPLKEMGKRGRAWMEREFSWAEVANEMVVHYQNMIDQNRRKETERATVPKAA